MTKKAVTRGNRRGGVDRLVERAQRRPRSKLCALLFLVLVAAFGFSGVGAARSVLLAFAIAASVFLVAIAHMFAHSDIARIRTRARDEDEGRWGALWFGVGTSGVVLVALGLELHASQAGGVAEVVLAALSLLLSWLFMNTLFALHYAHAFYGDSARRAKLRALEFPGGEDPDYWDFAYFAIVIGMTFQVSDVQIADRSLRRIVLAHGLIAFFFNVVIIALSVNVVAGKA